ncbi:MAG TPA: histidine kinase [Noviherbaspirillum sp.]|nr:two-component system, LytT family, sensor histidine kinase AlgZ [Pseudoxanthomonas sp. CF125]HVK94866.1 histidine kinase [Noviherbaspirillum sp.]
MLETVVPWLPDFCRRARIMVMLGMAEMVVVVVALWPGEANRLPFAHFLSASAFALWIAIAVSVMLCMSRQVLSRFTPVLGVTASLGLSAAISVAAAGIVYALFTALGKPPVDVSFWRFVSASAAIAVLITASAMRYFYVSDRWTLQLNANARAEADALQARIRPHFLFNSMNLIASLVRTDPVVAERAVLDLSDLFRAALGVGEGESTLAQEVELARRYLSIESLRLGERLQVRWRMEEPLPWEQRLPHLVLQPLVENAVLHGISRIPEGGLLEIDLSVNADILSVTIINPALPPDSPVLRLQQGSGHAQRNIAYRLLYAFNSRAKLTSGWKEGVYTCVMAVPTR